MKQLLEYIPVTWWSEVSAFIFGLCFLVLLVWVYLPARRAEYRRGEMLPLED